VSFF
jgi:hypothetical protein